jgi:HSP20 family protein
MGSIRKPSLQSSKSTTAQKILNPFLHIQQEVDRALHGFYDVFEHKPFELRAFENLNLSPLMDLVEDKNFYKIEVEMPGMDEKDIEISLSGNILTIRGEKSVSSKDERKNYIAREINYGKIERSITLPQLADADKASATFKKGMLWISIPKRSGASTKSHHIDIKRV